MPSRHLALEDHDFDLTVHFRLHLKSSEMDSFYEGYTIVLGSSGGPIYPVQALLRYLAVRGPTPGHLCVCCNGGASYTCGGQLHVSNHSAIAGVSGNYSSHSFRMGGRYSRSFN